MLQVLGRVSLVIILTCAIAGSFVVFVFLAAVEVFAPSHYTVAVPDMPEISAPSAIIFDAETGEVLYAKDEHAALPIASVTKLPVAAAVSGAHDLWATTTIVYQDVISEGRAGSLGLGESFALHTLLFPLLLESSNDAAAAINRMTGTAVADANAYADALGLEATTFVDTSGLSSENISSAEDLARILTDLYTNRQETLDITRIPYYLYGSHGWRNSNPFASIPEFVGGKHGYTEEAGHTAALIFNESFEGDIRPIGYVVLGSGNLSKDVEALRDHVHEYVRYR